MNKIGAIINLFYKKRFLLKSSIQEPQTFPMETDCCYIDRISKEKIPEKVIHFLRKKIKISIINKRLECEDIDLFIAFDKKTDQPLGYYWSLTSHQKIYWHDAFSIPLNSALVFNAYISDKARRKGVYSNLIFKTHQYLLNEKKCSAVFTIVEKKNIPSLTANLKANHIKYKKNLLIKFFGKNIFSVYKNGDCVIYLIPFRKKNVVP